MKLTVYVAYDDYGNYEGCSPPKGVYLSTEEAELHRPKYSESYGYAEFEIEIDGKEET